MAVATQKNVASLMRKTLDRQAEIRRMRMKFKEKQIEQILLSYTRDGNAGPYGDLVKVLQEYPLNDNNYKILLEDCLSSVVLFGREMKPFVDIVCKIEWATRSEELVELFSMFVLNLLTAHTYHCPRVMTCFLELFKGKYSQLIFSII